MAAYIDSGDADLDDVAADERRGPLRRLWRAVKARVGRWATPALAETYDARTAAAADRHRAEVAALKLRLDKAEADRDTARLQCEAFSLMHARMTAALRADTAAYNARGEAAAGR